MFRRVENKDRYKTAQNFYWHVRDKDVDYLFTNAALTEAEKRALKNPEDIPEPRNPKGQHTYFNGFVVGMICGFVTTAVSYFIAQWIIGN